MRHAVVTKDPPNMAVSTVEYKFFVGKPEGQRHTRRWEDNIKTYLTEIVCEYV